MPNTITPLPDTGSAPVDTAGQGWLAAAWGWAHTANTVAVVSVVVLALLVLAYLARKARKAIKSPERTEKFVSLVMFLGMVWSADVVWEITGYVGFPLGLRIAVCAVLEFMLLVAMLRTKDSMDRTGDPGRHGDTAWTIAWLMALVAFIVGLFLNHSFAVAVFRPIIPIVLTKLWWDGILGDAKRQKKSGSFRWTPRRLLIAMGAIEASDRDVETVNRDRLVTQMVSVHRRWEAAKADSDRKARLEGKLVRLSEKADDSVIAEVRERRARSNWFTVRSLPASHPALNGSAPLGSAESPQGSIGGTQRPAQAEQVAASANGSQSASGRANHAESTPVTTAGKVAGKPPARPAEKSAATAKRPTHPFADDPNPSVKALARAYSRNPAKTNAELARQAKVSEGTANRYLPKIRAAAVDSANADADEERAQGPLIGMPITALIPEPKTLATAGVLNGYSPTHNDS